TQKRQRRVRPNAATANFARLDAAVTACDAETLPALVAERSETIDHTTGVTYDRQGWVATLRLLLRARDPRYRHEPLAPLGDSLALCRELPSAGGFAGTNFDVGAYEKEQISLVEVDAEGNRARSEYFAADRLGDAIARLYGRYADLLPAGSERA